MEGGPSGNSGPVDRPRRSKGCKVCIQRKIKCDEKLPSCTQCLRGKRKCHGSISTIFLNVDSSSMTTTTTYVNRDHEESPKKKQKNDLVWAEVEVGPSGPLETRQTSPETTRQTSREGGTNLTARSVGNETFPAPVLFSIPIPIDNSHAITQQCLSKFIHFFARATRQDVIFNSWMARLPSMLASPSPLIGRTIIAASLAYYGRYSNDERIIAESYRWYGDGLARQIQTLAIMQRERREPTIEEICAPLMLSFFEITCSTSPTAYFQHLMGAARMLEKHGPEKCSKGVLFALFQTLRLQLIYPTIMMRIPSILGTDEWLTVPFHGREKSIVDYIIDIITMTSSLLPQLDSLSSLSPPAASLLKASILTQAQAFKARLDEMWQDLRKRGQFLGWRGDRFQGVRGFDFEPSTDEEMEGMGPMVIDPNDGLVLDSSLSSSLWNDAHLDPQTQDIIPSHTPSSLPIGGRDTSRTPTPTRSCEPTEMGERKVYRDIPQMKGRPSEGFGARLQGEETKEKDPLSLPRNIPVHLPVNLLSAHGPAARPLAFYSTARLLILSILNDLSSPLLSSIQPYVDPPLFFDDQIEAHSACVLAVAKFMSGREIGYAYLRLILPLCVVGRLGNEEQRRQARERVRAWGGDQKGLEGICDVAIEGMGD